MANDVTKAFEVEDGFLIEDGPFITGGTASPIGVDCPVSTLYIQSGANGNVLWRKWNTGVNDWRPEANTDRLVVFDPLVYSTLQAAIDVAETLPASWQPMPALSGNCHGVSVEIPAGYFDEDIVIKRAVSLVGRGRGVTSIKSVTSRPPPNLVFTGNTINGSRIVTNVSVNTRELYEDAVFSCASFASDFSVDTIDSPTQFTSTFSANATTVGATFTIAVQINHQALINLSVYNDSVVLTNETAPSSGVFKRHLFGQETPFLYGMTIFGCKIVGLTPSNINSLGIMNSEIDSATTFLNVGGECANSLFNQSIIVQFNDTNAGYSIGVGGTLYFDASNIIGTVLYEKPAGSIAPAGGLFNCFSQGFSNTGGGSVTVNGSAYKPVTPGDWLTPPTETTGGLDELAARPLASSVISDTAYNSTSWNSVTTIAPSKNAVRDQIETMLTAMAALVSDTAYNAGTWDSVTTIAPSKNAVRDQIETMLTSISGLVIDSIADSDTTHAPSRNAVFDALALKADLASPTLTGNPTAPTQSAGNNSTRISTTAYVDAVVSDTIYGVGWDTVTGIAPSKNAVYDQMELRAPLASPALTGNPTAPTQSAGNNSTRIATTAYADALISDTAYDATTWNSVGGIAPSKNAVRDQIETMLTSMAALVSDTAYNATSWDAVTTIAPSKNAVRDQIETMLASIALKANLASPALTGTPTAPTASAATNNTQIATTAYADALISDTVYGVGWNGVGGIGPSKNAVYDQMELRAPLASPALTGTPTAPTAAPATNNTQVATTAYADAIAALKANIASPTFTGVPAAPTAAANNNSTQIATTAYVDTADALKANLASPTLTGTPLAPTAAVGTNTTQIATTAFVQAAVAADIVSGTATIDFGSFPGASDTSLAITGQALIVAGSVVSAWIRPVATSDHTADEHWVETMDVFAGNISAGTGFTIYAKNTNQILEPTGKATRIYGTWTVAWQWN